MITNCKFKMMTRPMLPPGALAAFTLIELLVVMAVISILAALLLPALAAAKEKAKVIRARGELYGIGLALEMYHMDNRTNPPVRVNCNIDIRDDWCELPIELAQQGYLPHGNKAGSEANMEDIFNRGHTYKYDAPGPMLINGTSHGTRQLWVPTNAPLDMSGGGKYFTDPKISPVRWVIWSLGPQPKSQKTLMTHSPMTSDSWYRQTGGGGVIARFCDRNGTQFISH